ncbi:MAG: hypothetical protein HKN26_11065 [Acidimicrobiales bacterium]|nr:hypothetical protein [Acidimicrobiales bacterium]
MPDTPTVPPPVRVEVDPEPTDEEMAAILAAYPQLWPPPVATEPADQTPAWRFSGRWWTQPNRFY